MMPSVLPLLCLSHCIIHRKQKQSSSKLSLSLSLTLTLCLLFFVFTHSPNSRLHFRILLSCSSTNLASFAHSCTAYMRYVLLCSASLFLALSSLELDPKLYLWTFQVCSLHLFVLNNVKLCLFACYSYFLSWVLEVHWFLLVLGWRFMSGRHFNCFLEIVCGCTSLMIYSVCLKLDLDKTFLREIEEEKGSKKWVFLIFKIACSMRLLIHRSQYSCNFLFPGHSYGNG